MVRKLLTGLILICLRVSVYGQTTVPSEQKLSLLFMGDIMGHDSQIGAAENLKTHTYDFNEVFRYIKPVISEPDIVIANFEVTLAGPPYEGYPRFSSPAAFADACRNAGIDCLVTANNHAADRGIEGITGTINRLDSLGISHTGTFFNQASKDSLHPLIIYKKEFSIALLNYTYSTNGIMVPEPLIVNMLDKTLITIDIEKAKSKNTDLIVLFLHCGIEYDTIPSKSQMELAEYFFSRGVHLIIGSHPHVLQRMAWFRSDTSINNKVVVYSLGNFVSNQRKPKTDGGSMVRIDLVKTGNSIYFVGAGYYLTWVYSPIENYSKRFFILPCSEFENRPEFFPVQDDYIQMKKFINDSRSLLYKQNINVKEYIFKGNNWLLNN